MSLAAPTTPEGIAITLEHIQAQLAILVTRSERAAEKADLHELERRVRVLEDERTERRAILWLIGSAVAVLGVPGLVLIVRALLASPSP